MLSIQLSDVFSLYSAVHLVEVYYILPIYRPEYGSLQKVRHFFPMTPVVALTATASTTQRHTLLQMLRNPTTEVSSVNKPNIYYRVIEFNPPSKPGRIIILWAATLCVYVYYCLFVIKSYI